MTRKTQNTDKQKKPSKTATVADSEQKKPFDPWTAAEEEALKEFYAGNERAFFQFCAADDIKTLKSQIEDAMQIRGKEAGNSSKLKAVAAAGSSILFCVKRAMEAGLVAPDWLSYAFNQRYYPVVRYEARNWSDPKSFGDSTGKKKLENRRKLRILNAFLLANCARLRDEYKQMKEGKKVLRGSSFLFFLTDEIKKEPELKDFEFDTIRAAYKKIPKILR